MTLISTKLTESCTEGSSSSIVTDENIISTPTVPNIPRFNTPQPALINFTPNGSEEWIREVEIELTPRVGMTFNSLEEGIKFYKVYAVVCGFETRLSTTKRFRDRTERTKCVVCNREGFKEAVKQTNSEAKKTAKAKLETKSPITKISKIRRFGCKAMIKFRFDKGKYVVDRFYEAHKHPLALAKNREFLKLSRNLSLYHKQTIVNHSKVNIGPTKTFRLCKENSNGYENVGASLLEFKNFQRDVKCFIGDRDAQMLIGKFQSISETRKGFFFAYDIDDGNNLRRVFWSDATARRNYSAFGDALSFDPTYRTNKYLMIFTPFTGVDNHNKSVTFGAALISNEDEESFVWVFKQFMKAMGNKEPQFIITDQDWGIKNAIPQVFKTARHRFCMWHIMQKLPGKVGTKVCTETSFLDRINSVVWDSDLETFEFEERWKKAVEDCGLIGHEWLDGIYGIREEWIPAYYRDLQMGNILRTTQRSESANSYFKKFENVHGTLIEFWLRFDTAMDQQRHTHKRLEMESEHSLPQTITPIPLEKHALSIYTHEIFYEFQEELKYSTCACSVAGFSKIGDVEVTTVDDRARRRVYDVEYVGGTGLTSCMCKLFQRRGLVCRHILWIWSGKRMEEIPGTYIMSRWTKSALRNIRFDFDGTPLDSYDAIDGKQLLMSDIWSEFYATISLLGRKEDIDVKNFLNILKAYRGKLAKPGVLTKNQELEMLLDCNLPTEVNILPPNQSKTKGSGKRLLNAKESAIEKSKKPKRMCSNCKRMGHHDMRNCPNPFAAKALEEEEQSEEE